MRIERNGETGILEMFVPATLVTIPTANRTLDNEMETPYGWATCHVEYPDGTEEDVQAIMWGSSIDSELFREGQEVLVRTQLEGEYAGNGVVELAKFKGVNITDFKFPEDGDEQKLEKVLDDYYEVLDDYYNENHSLPPNYYENEEEVLIGNTDTPNENRTNKKEYRGCIVFIIFCIVSLFLFSPFISTIGFLAYPLILITAVILSKWTESFWHEE